MLHVRSRVHDQGQDAADETAAEDEAIGVRRADVSWPIFVNNDLA